MADFTAFIGRSTAPDRRTDTGTIGAPKSDYVQPKHEQVMTSAALSALASVSPVTALPMAGKLGHDLALDGVRAFVDPSNVAALAGIMTYGASSVRMGANRVRMRRMVARGESLPRIRRATGYEPGPFGMGAETRGDATLRPQAVFRPQGVDGPLGELGLVHPDLERAYPGIARTPVHIVPDGRWADTVAEARSRMSEWSRGDTSTGFTSTDGIFIRGKTPGETMPEYVDRSDRTLVHELQHVAQTRDGLRPPRGHATREDYLRDAREVDARNSAERRDYLPQERGLIPRRVTQDVAPEDVRQAAKGGDNFASSRNFLATDEVPETIFGIPVVQRREDYTESDLVFFKDNPKAAGFYEMGDEGVASTVRDSVDGVHSVQSAQGATGIPEADYEYTRKDDRKTIDPVNIKGTGISFTASDRRKVPDRLRKDFEQQMDKIAKVAPVLVPPDWRTHTDYDKNYDYGAAYLAGKLKPMKAPDGHYYMSEAGQLPTHPMFSDASYYARLPKYKNLAGRRDSHGNYIPGPAELHANAVRDRETRLRRTWTDAVSQSQDGGRNLAKVLFYLFSEGSPFQKGQSADRVINGHRARLGVSMNDAKRRSDNQYNGGRMFNALDNLVKRSTAPSYGQGPGTNFIDTAAHKPKFRVLAESADAAKVTTAAITNAAAFLEGSFRYPELPADAYYYGDGPNAFSHGDAEDLDTTELKKLGALPSAFRIGRPKKRGK